MERTRGGMPPTWVIWARIFSVVNSTSKPNNLPLVLISTEGAIEWCQNTMSGATCQGKIIRSSLFVQGKIIRSSLFVLNNSHFMFKIEIFLIT